VTLNLGKPVPECQKITSDFTAARDEGSGGGNNRNYDTGANLMHLQQYHHQHTQFLQVKCPSHHSTNSVKALMVMKHTRDFVKKEPRHLGPAGLKSQKTHSYVQQLHRVDRPVNFLAVSSHSLANKTVVQLQPKSTTGSSFLLKYIRYFCRRVWSITLKNFLFRVSVWVNNCLYPFMLNISLILLHKW